MSARIFAYPVEFEPNSTNPKHPQIFDAAQKFCEEQFGHRIDMAPGSLKTWVVIKTEESGEGFKVIGLSQFRRVLDIPTFHVAPADETLTGDEHEAALQETRNVRDMLTSRMWGYAQDQFGCNQDVFVFIDPATERFWKPYLRLLRAKPANRYILTV